MPMVTVYMRFNATTSCCSIRAMWASIWFLAGMSTYMFLQVVAVSTGTSTDWASMPQALPTSCKAC